MSIKILCIETSTDVCGVAISADGECVGIEEVKGFKHSSRLSPMIVDLLKSTGIVKKELNAIAISKGPGSYTGLRVGASTAKGWAFGLDIPLIAIDTLRALAFGAKPHTYGRYIAPMMDARRNEVYAALYDSALKEVRPTHSLILDDGVDGLIPSDTDVLICGNGSFKAKPFKSTHIDILSTECSALNLVSLGFDSYKNESFETLDHFEPFYLKPPNIAQPKSILKT